MIRFHGIEKITPRIRKLAAEFPGKAAQAMRDAAEMTVAERVRQELATNQNGNKFPPNWKGDLSSSVRVRTTRKSVKGGDQKYASVIIEYGPYSGSVSSKGYWKRFEAGGQHGDWPHERIKKWGIEKFQWPEDIAGAIAARFIKYLETHGAKQYPIMETAWEYSRQEFIDEWRANLSVVFSKSTNDAVPF